MQQAETIDTTDYFCYYYSSINLGGERKKVELSPKQQTVELIKKAKNILAVTHKNPDGDALGSLIAIKLVLEKLDKKVTALYCGDLNTTFNFLPSIKELKTDVEGSRDFIISLDTGHIPSSEIKLGYKHDKENHKLSIIISPSKGHIAKEDISLEAGQPKYDLIIALDSPDLERLGSVYDSYTELFYETPIVNIDHHPSNDYFGKVSWVDLTATSTAEMLVSLIESLAGQEESKGKKLLSEDVATALLTGIITDTGSFQNANTTPKSFTVAAQLVAAGAEQQEIIQNVFRTKSLSTLRIWGRVLTNITQESTPPFVWSYVTKKDLEDVEAKPTQLSGVIDELLKSAPGVDFAILFSERTDPEGEPVLHATLRAVSQSINVSDIAQKFGGGGHIKAAAFEMKREGKFAEQVKNIIEELKNTTSSSSSLSDNQLEMPPA